MPLADTKAAKGGRKEESRAAEHRLLGEKAGEMG
jgi:hypothetical protein